MSIESKLGENTFINLDAAERIGIQRLVDGIVWIPIPKPEILFGRTNVIDWGADLCYIPDMEEILRDTPSLIPAIFAPSEIAYSMTRPRPGASLAERYAVKEAGFKAFSFTYRDTVVAHLPDRHPVVRLEGSALQKVHRYGVKPHLVSMSHEGDYALAFVAIVQVEDLDIDLIDILRQ